MSGFDHSVNVHGPVKIYEFVDGRKQRSTAASRAASPCRADNVHPTPLREVRVAAQTPQSVFTTPADTYIRINIQCTRRFPKSRQALVAGVGSRLYVGDACGGRARTVYTLLRRVSRGIQFARSYIVINYHHAAVCMSVSIFFIHFFFSARSW